MNALEANRKVYKALALVQNPSTKAKKLTNPTPHFPQDPVGAEFCHRFWRGSQGWSHISGNCPTKDQKTEWRTEKFPIQPDELYRRHQDPEEAIGLGFGKETSYFLIDLDRGSNYHPYNDEGNYNKVVTALKQLGIHQPVVIRSTHSEGLHVYGWLPSSVNSFNLACALKCALSDEGITIADGQVEIFPNVKAYGRNGEIVNFKAHRLPLQPGSGSYLLDGTFTPYSDSVEDLLGEIRESAKTVDMELLTEAIALGGDRVRHSKGFGNSKTAERWQRYLLKDRIQTGFTSFSQTNDILKDIAIYGRVFEGLEGEALENFTYETVIAVPGYDRYCRHKHEIKRRVRERCRSVEKLYYPYGSKCKREGTYKDLVNSANTSFYHAGAKQQAKDRIEEAIASLEAKGNYPEGDTARVNAITAESKTLTGICISNTTLYKYKELWHSSGVMNHPETISADIDEASTEINENTETLEPLPDGLLHNFPYMKGLNAKETNEDAPQGDFHSVPSLNSVQGESPRGGYLPQTSPIHPTLQPASSVPLSAKVQWRQEQWKNMPLTRPGLRRWAAQTPGVGCDDNGLFLLEAVTSL